MTLLAAAPAVASRRLLAVLSVVAVAGLVAGCGVVDAAGSVAGAAVDLTVDAVDTTTDIVTAPL